MKTKKNTILGKNKTVFYQFIVFLIFYLFIIPLNLAYSLESLNKLEGDLVEIKILDKMSSKNSKLTLKIGEEKKFENLLIKALKCKNSEFDDNPEITAYIQAKDLANKNKDDVFIFNGWMFSSSPSIAPFDHPVYDVWLVGCN